MPKEPVASKTKKRGTPTARSTDRLRDTEAVVAGGAGQLHADGGHLGRAGHVPWPRGRGARRRGAGRGLLRPGDLALAEETTSVGVWGRGGGRAGGSVWGFSWGGGVLGFGVFGEFGKFGGFAELVGDGWRVVFVLLCAKDKEATRGWIVSLAGQGFIRIVAPEWPSLFVSFWWPGDLVMAYKGIYEPVSVVPAVLFAFLWMAT